ncbi:MAG: hypothetical protein ACOX1V_04630 [Candidatus Iainarchaeum sp.]|jgi:hypothetical protein
MQDGFLDPILGNSTKSIIVKILSESPLTLKELCAQIKKTTTKPLTYQAIHKATTEMIKEGILQKNEKTLQINQEWVEKVKKAFENIKIDSKKNDIEDKVKIYYLPNYSVFARFIINLAYSFIGKDETPGICIMKHSWPALGLEEEYIQKMNKFLKANTYYDLTENSTPLDCAFAKTLEKMGKKIIVGSKISFPYDLVCKGDSIIQIIFEKQFAEVYDKIYKKHKQLDENAINDILQEIVSKSTNIQVIQSTNKKFAEELRLKVIKEYKEVNKKIY